MGTGFEKTAKRIGMGLLTVGTSEIKTGAGEYHDETVADSLFPKNMIGGELMRGGDRDLARQAADKKAKDDLAALNPGPGPDAADKLLRRAGADSLVRTKTKQGRRSAFLSGGY